MNNEKYLDNAIQLLDIVQNVELSDYWNSKLPNSIDEEVMEIISSVMNGAMEQRQDFLSLIDDGAIRLLDVFGTRMTMLSVRKNSCDYLLKGLIALEFAATRSDYRDILMTLSLFYRSAEKLNVDPEKLFREASQYAPSPAVAEFILGYLRRSPENRRIEIMGFKEVDGPSGLIYQYANHPIPKGFL